MPGTNQNFRETNIIGSNTRQWGVSSSLCPSLVPHGIAHVGFGEIGNGYLIQRNDPDFAHINLCWGGKGRIYVNGRWTPVKEGIAGLFPAHLPHGGCPANNSIWKICWVIYREPKDRLPTIANSQTVLVQTDPRQLSWAIMALYREVNGENDPQILDQWAQLIHQLVKRIAKPWRRNERLWQLWEKVDADLNHPWTVSRLAQLASISEVHLRRICQRETGRRPLEQITWLRMRRAADLLESTDQTVEAIAWAVGYSSVFAFSNAFKIWQGIPPRKYRKKRLKAEG